MKPCGQLPSADLQWSEPTPGFGLQGHSHKTAGNPLSSARITAHQDQTVVYLPHFNKLTVGAVFYNANFFFYFIKLVESITNKGLISKHIICVSKITSSCMCQ